MQVTRKAEATLPTEHGTFRILIFEDDEGKQHTALLTGKITEEPLLVRVHSQCLTGDTLKATKCDCGPQLGAALSKIGKEGGVLVYLQQEGRGIGLANKIKAYALQDQGMDTVEANEKLGFKADERDYTIGAQILADLGVKKIKLLTNNPKKVEGLQKYGMEIVERIPLITPSIKENKDYLSVKKEKLGHLFEDKGVVK